MKEILYIIGGSGFIGKNLIVDFNDTYQIYVFDKFIDRLFFDAYPAVVTEETDLANERIPSAFPPPHYIINLASVVTAERDLQLFDEMISSNLKVLLNLYERFKNAGSLKLFIQFGSSEEYGNGGSPFVEDRREAPNSPYALVKQLTVNTALMLYTNYNFPVMVVRPGNLFGPYQNENKFIPYIIRRLRQNLPLDVTPCEQKRDWIYAKDFAKYIGLLLVNYRKCKGEIVNVSSGRSISLRSIIEYCKQQLNSSSSINYGAIPYRENEVMDLKCSVGKLSRIIGGKIECDIENDLSNYMKLL